MRRGAHPVRAPPRPLLHARRRSASPSGYRRTAPRCPICCGAPARGFLGGARLRALDRLVDHVGRWPRLASSSRPSADVVAGRGGKDAGRRGRAGRAGLRPSRGARDRGRRKGDRKLKDAFHCCLHPLSTRDQVRGSPSGRISGLVKVTPSGEGFGVGVTAVCGEPATPVSNWMRISIAKSSCTVLWQWFT